MNQIASRNVLLVCAFVFLIARLPGIAYGQESDEPNGLPVAKPDFECQYRVLDDTLLYVQDREGNGSTSFRPFDRSITIRKSSSVVVSVADEVDLRALAEYIKATPLVRGLKLSLCKDRDYAPLIDLPIELINLSGAGDGHELMEYDLVKIVPRWIRAIAIKGFVISPGTISRIARDFVGLEALELTCCKYVGKPISGLASAVRLKELLIVNPDFRTKLSFDEIGSPFAHPSRMQLRLIVLEGIELSLLDVKAIAGSQFQLDTLCVGPFYSDDDELAKALGSVRSLRRLHLLFGRMYIVMGIYDSLSEKIRATSPHIRVIAK